MNEKRLQQQLRTFERILQAYGPEEPLARFLSAFYKENRQMGSNDRRTANRLLYHYFRLGNSVPELPVLERLAIAEFLCTDSSDVVQLLQPAWVPHMDRGLPAKIQFMEEEKSFSLETVFPLMEELSGSIQLGEFLRSHFSQPRLFIRIHRGKEKQVKNILRAHAIDFEEIGGYTLAFLNGVQLDRIPTIQGKYEVQDYSSQRTSELFMPSPKEDWWDACAGSGGKSILLKQIEPDVNLMVSDVRNSILRNLDVRFADAGIRHYRRKIIDLSKAENDILKEESFDGIIIDAPCSGSGTWGRTPESLVNFTVEQLEEYTVRQKQILQNTVKYLRPGKSLIYITCSVYKKENEEQVEFIKGLGLSLQEMHYYEGADIGADTLFAARFIG